MHCFILQKGMCNLYLASYKLIKASQFFGHKYFYFKYIKKILREEESIFHLAEFKEDFLVHLESCIYRFTKI